MAIDQNLDSNSSLFDDLYCQEDDVEDVNNEKEYSVTLTEQDLCWEDEELQSLFNKETNNVVEIEYPLRLARKQAVEWILKVNARYGFSTLTAIFAVNYLDRFLSSLQFQRDKPWMIQLAAVTCLSLAAKVEETHVPLLLDLQVENAKFLFESKTIQRMELLVLSALKWKMNPVTPLSFLDHVIRRLGLKSCFHLEFLKKCENLILSIMPDSRFARYLPSVVATATMFRVVHQVEPFTANDYGNQLLGILKINMEEVNDCREFISEASRTGPVLQKRRYFEAPSSPNDVTDALLFSCDSSNESWGVASSISSSSAHQPLNKRRRVREQQMKLPLLSRVFVDAVGSPN